MFDEFFRIDTQNRVKNSPNLTMYDLRIYINYSIFNKNVNRLQDIFYFF